MYQDTEKISEALWDRHFDAVEVDWHEFLPMFQRAEPGWDPFDFPDNYRWFLIRGFPVKELDVTLARLMKDADIEVNRPEWEEFVRQYRQMLEAQANQPPGGAPGQAPPPQRPAGAR